MKKVIRTKKVSDIQIRNMVINMSEKYKWAVIEKIQSKGDFQENVFDHFWINAETERAGKFVNSWEELCDEYFNLMEEKICK